MPKPLSQVPEVEEHKEVTIEKEQPQASLKKELAPTTVPEAEQEDDLKNLTVLQR